MAEPFLIGKYAHRFQMDSRPKPLLTYVSLTKKLKDVLMVISYITLVLIVTSKVFLDMTMYKRDDQLAYRIPTLSCPFAKG